MSLFSDLIRKVRRGGSASSDGRPGRQPGDFEEAKARLEQLFRTALDMYCEAACPCAYPRLRQIVGVDCTQRGLNYACFETELMIGMCRPLFDVGESERADENANETWTCRKCGSTFEYSWSDLSIHVSRQTLELTHLATQEVGKAAADRIPLYIGLRGHALPPDPNLVDFEEYEAYILER
jgi:hypothetical protein